jgi:PPK2 family polyphosphate:nucleotide phosphotransferase
MDKPGTLSARYRVEDGSHFRLKDFDPADTNGMTSQEEAAETLQAGIAELARLQERLWAQDRYSLLVIFQALDAAGKDSAIKHVMSGVNPQGCEVHSFRAPSDEELRHDYLWRAVRALPERGRIGIFNRSYYEEMLVVRVHPELLEKERIPPELLKGDVWQQRFLDARILEQYLARHGTVILKFYLNLSRREQRKRFLARIDQPNKNWKFSMADIAERQHWDEYMAAYQEVIQHTSSKEAPWYVIPADHKWFTRLVVADAIIHALEKLGPGYPRVTDAMRKELDEAKAALLAEGDA